MQFLMLLSRIFARAEVNPARASLTDSGQNFDFVLVHSLCTCLVLGRVFHLYNMFSYLSNT